ncbi:MAG: hypothetical protein IKB58_03570 [Oscillospiraceae bacterium]|nr:hypothetical protein [Oscillospiraceae bacterium]MBR2927556.1 hypothetical protein [Oscillospiraceae bacterium]MBR6677505.1 hypothetical protein [Oscillospiraceae bacterium]
MTLGEGKRKVRKLLDEYSNGGEITVDEDLENRMADLFDLGQKDIAQVKKLYRVITLQLTGGEGMQVYDLPKDMMELVSVQCGGEFTGKYDIIGGKLIAEGNDMSKLLIEYVALPATIPGDAGDEYELEVAEDAANCIPYYVAAHCLLAEVVTDFSPYWQIYLLKKAQLRPTVRHYGDGQGVRQVLFGR